MIHLTLHKSASLFHAVCATPEPHLVRVLSLIAEGHTSHPIAVGGGGERVTGICNIILVCIIYIHTHNIVL